VGKKTKWERQNGKDKWGKDKEGKTRGMVRGIVRGIVRGMVRGIVRGIVRENKYGRFRIVHI
jgi:hypothetical protein